MPHVGNETELIAAAQKVLGDGETVVSAGVFGLQDLMHDMVLGQMAGGMTAGTFGGLEGSVAGTLFGGLLAKHAAAKEAGVTLKLIVAVTATKVHVLNWDESISPDRVVASFDRATTAVKIKHFGLSLMVTIDDAASGAHMKLHASASRAMAQYGPDHAVLEELTRTG